MKKPSIKVVVAIFIIIIVGIIYYFQEMKTYERVDIEKESVVVAVEDIPENTIIEKDMVKVEERFRGDVNKQKMFEGVTGDIDLIIGRRTITPLYRNEIVHRDRLIENEPYMNDIDLDKNKFMITVMDEDKALDIQEGDYIDIWLKPTKEGLADKNSVEVEKLFEKLKVYESKTENYTNSSDRDKTTGEENGVAIYLTVLLSEEEIKEYLSLVEGSYISKISVYGENLEYKILEKRLSSEEADKNITEKASEILINENDNTDENAIEKVTEEDKKNKEVESNE
ncbi:SAF domain-containing protein [Senegalia massiliensis]|nr:SAF domain-containing protein [Senegalia massiliensis]